MALNTTLRTSFAKCASLLAFLSVLAVLRCAIALWVFLAPLAGVVAHTGSAGSATTLGDVRVGVVVGVPAGAAGFGCVALSHVAPADVLGQGHWLKMCRVTAPALATQMIQFEPLGDGTSVEFIEPPVGTDRVPIVPKPSVSVPLARRPVPTSSRGINGVLLIEAVDSWSSDGHLSNVRAINDGYKV